MDPLYRPHGVEERWQRTWEEEGLYRAGAGARRDETFVIAVPPPNVTGDLHMGHALNGSIQDVLIRWHRMQGYDTLWQPGYDHAGIATQNVVERELAAEGTSRKEIGRANRIVNWCPFHETAISDLEVVHEEKDDTLTYARYPFTDGSGSISVAT